MNRMSLLILAIVTLFSSPEISYAKNKKVQSVVRPCSFSVSPSGEKIAIGFSNGNLAIYSLCRHANHVQVSKDCSWRVGEYPVQSISWSSDGKSLLAGGASVLSITKICLNSNQTSRIPVDIMGSIIFLGEDTKAKIIFLVDASNTLGFYKKVMNAEEQWKQSTKMYLGGGFIRTVVLSHRRQYLALLSQNEVKKHSTKPALLTIIDLFHKSVVGKYEFNKLAEYNTASMVWNNDDSILQVFCSGLAFQLAFDTKQKRFVERNTNSIPLELFSKYACNIKDIYWVGYEKLLYKIRKEKQQFKVTRLKFKNKMTEIVGCEANNDLFVCLLDNNTILFGDKNGKILAWKKVSP